MALSFLEWRLRLAYRVVPGLYLELAKRPFLVKSPGLIGPAFELVGEDHWPLILWIFGRQYVNDGGLATYPNSKGFEDIILRDAAGRDKTPGPIRDQVVAMRHSGNTGMESLSTSEGRAKLEDLVKPILKRDERLRNRLDEDDLSQEALLRLQEFMQTPGIRWDVGQDWGPDRVKPTRGFARNVLHRLTARKYRTDTKIERETYNLGDAELHSQDTSFEAAELRMELNDLISALPPKQREAVETHRQAIEEGISLEEMSRRLGRNPQRDRENFKAVQRRFRK